MSSENSWHNDTIVFGGGLAGLSAGYELARLGMGTVVYEAHETVGGLSRTIRYGDFLYDIGGHRFFTKDKAVDELVAALMGDELIRVDRSSKIFMRNMFFDYPPRPLNAVSGLGVPTVLKILWDYAVVRARDIGGKELPCVSLEDWVVSNFGREMFNLYFREYSEKVWGLRCDRISRSWVAKRIQGLDLMTALKNAFFRVLGNDVPTLADNFLYPELGIGRLSDRFAEEISRHNTVETRTRLVGIKHDGRRITCATMQNCKNSFDAAAAQYISTIPMNSLVMMMSPEPPPEVMASARSLGYRDLITVAVAVDRASVTDQSWIYIPEKKYRFGRLHEPKIWSSRMAPKDKTLVVVEYFCFRDDETWSLPDEELSRITVEGLEELGFLQAVEVIGTDILRVSRAYPLFEVGYEEHCEVIYKYLEGFENLSIAGRSGMFQYQNMDHAIDSGIRAARETHSKASR